MVCRLLQVSVPLSSPPLQSPASSVSSSGRQLRSELAQAVERTMVFTRSHDNTPTIGKESAMENGIDVVTSGKRKSQHDADAATPSKPSAKRRRAVEKLKNDIASTPQIATAVVIEVKEQDYNEIRKEELLELESDTRPEEVTEIAAPVSTRSPRPKFGGYNTHTENILTESVSVDLVQEHGHEGTSIEDNNEPGQLPPSSNAAKTPKGLTKVNSPITEDGTNEEPSPESIDEIKTTFPPLNPPRSTHRRFDSAEPEPFHHQPQEAKKDEKPPVDNPSDSSDDEAPETVTASSGQAQALTAALEQSKAAAQRKTERKLKRRERDARLKEQARAAKRTNKTDVAPKPSKAKAIAVKAAVDDDDTPPLNAKPQTPNKAKQPLPALLPEHILAEEPPIRPLIPLPSSTSKALPSLKKRFLDLEQKPPKDIRKGRLKIRVLQEGNGILPPKASLQGKALREAWLMGQRGKGTVVERRKMRGQGGFVRR